jgi:hypothetical protein
MDSRFTRTHTLPTHTAHLQLRPLEARDVPTAGGGFTAAGLLGQYFANPDLSGDPAFTRRDVRVDFDWGDRAPGGSTSPGYRDVGADNFSVRWTGQVIGQFSQPYTFTASGDDGIRLWLRPAGGTSDWTLVVDRWDPTSPNPDHANYSLVAGRAYDIKLEYRDVTGPASAHLLWSSPSTPQQVIDPAVSLGVNANTYDSYVYADAAKASWNEWGDPVDYFGNPRVATDANGWPLSDAGHLIWESRDATKTAGTYLLRFQGEAQVSGWMNRGQFSAGGVDYGLTLPFGAGYDPATNITTAEVTVQGADIFGLNFVHTHRTPGDPEGSGVTDVQFMRPTAANATTHYQPGELFDADVKDAYSRYTTLRYLTANFNPEADWSERKLPSQMVAAWGDQRAVWEYEVMLANETGKDLYITIPVKATDEYIRNLANLIKYGSDGVNPYTGFVADPVYPGLNPNLRVYVEWGNEFWNWAYPQAGWAADQNVAAVQAGTPEGQIVNFDGMKPGGDFRRWAALKTVETSNTFRDVWGDAAMGNNVRVLLEYQYDNQQYSATETLKFLDRYYNNGDGLPHVADPHPVSYYIWGAGGAAYYGASNPRGLVTNITVPGGTFESARVGAGGTAKASPAGTPWKFTGDAGVYRDRAGVPANTPMGVLGIGNLPATPQGSQAMYVTGTGAAEVTITFPRAGVYAIDLRAAAKPGQGNSLDFYLNGERVTSNGRDLTPPPYAWWPGNGNRDANVFSPYGTTPVTISRPGRYTFKIVGRGTADQTTAIDDVRVESVDAIFKSKIPTGVRAAGEETRSDLWTQLTAEAAYAKAYGLNVVAYEGGWSLGGDHECVPIQTWAKYNDPRAAKAMAAAIDAFYRADGDLFVLGGYDQWQRDDAAHADSYPLVQGIDDRLAHLPAAPTAKVVVRGTVPVTVTSAKAVQALSIPVNAAPGDWMSFTVQVTKAGMYRVTDLGGPGGPAVIYADGVEIGRGPVNGTSGLARLDVGVHTIRIQSVGGWFLIQAVKLERVGE